MPRPDRHRHPASPPSRAAARRARLGARGEELAARHLRDDDGLEVLARNWRVHDGEIRGELDVVALDAECGILVVVEVKTRRGDAYGGPLRAVTPDKQDRIRRLALAFLHEAGLGWPQLRFDVVGVWLVPGRPVRIEHVEGAF
jgi:putative endonuclease